MRTRALLLLAVGLSTISVGLGAATFRLLRLGAGPPEVAPAPAALPPERVVVTIPAAPVVVEWPAPTLAPAARWLGVTARQDVIAAWTRSELWVSRDRGRHFARELHGSSGIRAVTVAPGGGVFALERRHLAFLPGDAKPTRWKVPDGSDTTWLGWAGGKLVRVAADIAVWDEAQQAFAKRADLPVTGNFRNDLWVEPLGTLYAMHGSEAACGGGGQWRERASLDDGEWAEMEWGLDAPVSWVLGAGGWAYDTNCEGEEPGDPTRICAVGPTGKIHRLDQASLPIGEVEDVVVRGEGGVAFVIAKRDLWRLVGPDVRRVATDVPADLKAPFADDGRLFGISDGHVVSFSEARGWTLLR